MVSPLALFAGHAWWGSVCGGLFDTPSYARRQAQGGLLQPVQMDAPAPEVHPDLKSLLGQLHTLLRQRRYQEILAQAGILLAQATTKADVAGQAYAYRFRARALQAMNRLEEAAAAWERAEALWQTIVDTALLAESQAGRAFCLWRTQPEQAKSLLERALATARAETRRPKAVADMFNAQGISWYAAGELEIAQRMFEFARATLERVAPDSLELADALNNLGVVADTRGDLNTAQRFYEQALAIRQRHAPESLAVADAFNNLAGIAYRRGDLERARELLGRAIALYERHAPDSASLANALANLGILDTDWGDLDAAQRHLERALQLLLKLLPNSVDVVNVFSNLMAVAVLRGDWEQAQRYGERALTLAQQLAPESILTAGAFNNLGVIAYNRSEYALARRHYERAIALYQRIAPDGLEVANTLGNLGAVAVEQNDYDAALGYYRRALRIYEAQAPNSLPMATVLNNLGVLLARLREWQEARAVCERALTIRQRYAPRSPLVAETLGNLARVALATQQPQQALSYLTEAVGIVESHRQLIANPEGRARFAERYFEIYPLLALTYVQMHQLEKAAEALERSRARAFAETLQRRRLSTVELPEPLRALIAEHERLEVQQQRLYAQLSQLAGDDAAAIAAAQDALLRLEQRQRTLAERLQREFPRYAQLLMPASVSTAQIQRSLDAGTVLLYHAILPDHLLIVAITRTAVKGYALPVPSQPLEREIQHFIRTVSKSPHFRTGQERQEMARLGQQLYARLIAPVQAVLSEAQRVLLCPDGILSQLPWGALVVGQRDGTPEYWAERVALHFTPSMEVYRQARRQGGRIGGVVAVAIAKYASSEATAARRTVAQATRHQHTHRGLPDLPEAQREVEQLQTLFGKRARLLLNEEATPDRVHSAARNAQVLHFACHAIADNANPLASALMLAPPGHEKGRLTTETILLSWQTNADLIVLSACETGVGLTRRYEGVYSLARAFMYAGARSVCASLWAVSDRSTAILMREFYKRYARGTTKDQALREAQRALARASWDNATPDEKQRFTDPYYWAGFVLIGDYK